jgi:transposase
LRQAARLWKSVRSSGGSMRPELGQFSHFIWGMVAPRENRGWCPSARQSGTRARAGKKGQGDTWLRGSLGQAAIGAARTATFLGERYARIARRRGKAKAQVAVARSILVIIWHMLSNPAARFTDLGYGYYQARTDTSRKLRNHIRQIQALGFDVTITKAA